MKINEKALRNAVSRINADNDAGGYTLLLAWLLLRDDKSAVLIDRREGEFWVGRTEFDSPEVDNEVLVTSHFPLKKGCFYSTLICDAFDYDLEGEAVDDWTIES